MAIANETRAAWFDALSEAERSGGAAPAPWMRRLEEALGAGASFDPSLVAAIASAGSNDWRGWLRLVAPFLQQAMPALDAAFGAAVRGGVPLDAPAVLASMLAHVPNLVAVALGPSIALELRVARERGLLEGATPEARYDFFIDALTDPEVLPAFWERHPVLARHVLGVVEGYTRAGVELLVHLAADWRDVAAALAPERSPGRLVEITPGEGDTHRGGHSVIKLRFDSGLRVVYKPREADTDLGYAGMAAWLAKRAPDLLELRAPRVVSRTGRSYHEFVEAAPCTTREELGRFFERQGMHLALLYVLRAVDVHSENMIPAGEHPVLVDLETLFAPRARRPVAEVNPANDVALSSVLGSLFLPSRVDATADEPGYDVSALGARTGQRASHEKRFLVALGTDDMHVVYERPEIDAIGVRPSLDGVDADPSAWVAEIVRGFTRVWQTIEANAEDFVAGPLGALRETPVRVIVRPTMAYLTLLVKSFHPSHLESGLARDRLFDLLHLIERDEPAIVRLVPSERADLQDGDIPYFSMIPSTRDMIDSRGLVIPNYFDEPPFDAAVRSVRGMNAGGLAQQVWLITASFATIPMGKGEQLWAPSRTDLAAVPISPDGLVERAVRIGDRLSDLVLRDGDRVGWLGLTLLHERDWSIVPSKTDLYAGGPGIALFLAHLGAITGEARFTELARAAVATALLEVDSVLGWERRVSVGIVGDLVGPVFALAHLGALWHDGSLLDRAEAIVRVVPRHLDPEPKGDENGTRSDTHEHDLLDGVAGCSLAMLALDRARPSPAARAVARRCADLLRADALPMPRGVAWRSKVQGAAPMGGVSHGVSGIALALSRLAGMDGAGDGLGELAREAMAYEMSLYDAGRGGFKDLRRIALEAAAPGDVPMMTTWCHGAPGIGLAQLEVPAFGDEARLAVEATLASGFGQNHSLCHGDFGNLELLFSVRDRPGFPGEDAFRERLGRVCASLDAQGPLSGVPLGVETPGLFAGIAGIGWQLLRFAAPARVPNVLTFEAPR